MVYDMSYASNFTAGVRKFEPHRQLVSVGYDTVIIVVDITTVYCEKITNQAVLVTQCLTLKWLCVVILRYKTVTQVIHKTRIE